MARRPRRPYLVRALYDWIIDSGLTPHILVAVDSEAVRVPSQHVSDGQIVLNISPLAVRDLDLGDAAVTFSGRFAGQPFAVAVPMRNVLAIYARESGEGMVFPVEGEEPDNDGPGPGCTGSPAEAGGALPSAPALKVIK